MFIINNYNTTIIQGLSRMHNWPWGKNYNMSYDGRRKHIYILYIQEKGKKLLIDKIQNKVQSLVGWLVINEDDGGGRLS